MALDNKTNSTFRKIGLLGASALLALNMACTKHESNPSNPTNLHAQKQKYVLQPLDFDVLDPDGSYQSYRNVTYKQSKNMCIEIPEGGRIRLVNPQKIDNYIEDIIMNDENNKKLYDPNGKSAFKNEVNTKSLGLKSGDNGRMTFNLEWGLKIPSSIGIPYEIIPATPEPEQQEAIPPPESEPVEEQPEPAPSVVNPGEIPYQVPYQVVRPVGFFQMFFGFPRVRYVRYPRFMGGPIPYRQLCYPNNFYRPNRQNFHQIRPNYCPPNRSNIHRVSPVRYSNLHQNIRSSPVRRR